MMKQKIGGYLAIGIGIAVAFGIFSSMDSEPDSSLVYRARLAEPSVYLDGIFSEKLSIQAGNYNFRFVPNGDSPQTLSISIKFNQDNSVIFSEDFILEGTPQGTESARYYTWDYLGEKSLSLPEDGEYYIVIDPHGNLLGAVTVEIVI